MAQLVAHLLCKQGVRGSSPLGSTAGQRPFPLSWEASLASVPQRSTAVEEVLRVRGVLQRPRGREVIQIQGLGLPDLREAELVSRDHVVRH
jgi:hypothetical protein